MLCLTRDKVRGLVRYEEDTGLFYLKEPRGCRKSGSVLGCRNPKGYVVIGILGKRVSAHRLAFLYKEGRYPLGDIDHINGNKADNRWSNLREVNRTLNIMNKGANCDNELGVRCVRVLKDTGKFQVRVLGKSYGCFNTLSEATSAANKVHKEVYEQEYRKFKKEM